MRKDRDTLNCVALCGVCGVLCCVWCVMCVVCVVWVVQMIHDTASLSWRVRMMQLIRVAEHLEASSRRPRHPFPALMAGEPLAVYLCTRPYQLTQPTNRYVEHLVNELQLENLYGQLNSSGPWETNTAP